MIVSVKLQTKIQDKTEICNKSVLEQNFVVNNNKVFIIIRVVPGKMGNLLPTIYLLFLTYNKGSVSRN